jgi:hypothetical protein
MEPGRGVDKIEIGRSTVADVKAVFGDDGVVLGGVFTYLRDGLGAYRPDRPANALRPVVFFLSGGVVMSIRMTGYPALTPPTELHGPLENSIVRMISRAKANRVIPMYADTEGVAGWAGTGAKRSGLFELEVFPVVESSDLVLTPGKGMRKLLVGKSTLGDVLKTFGQDARVVREDGGRTVVEYPPSTMEWLDRRRPWRVRVKYDTVERIDAGPESQIFETPQGLKTGATRAEVLEMYGKPPGTMHGIEGGPNSDTYMFMNVGLVVHVDGDSDAVDWWGVEAVTHTAGE